MKKSELKAYIKAHPQGCVLAVNGGEDEIDIMFFKGHGPNPDMYTARTGNYEEEHPSLESLVDWMTKEFTSCEEIK